MHKSTTALLLGSVLFAGVMTAPSLYAQGNQEPSGSMMGRGMMGDRNTNDDGAMMGMMGMMKMMMQMSRMMDQCSNMMSADNKPNDQWRKNSPSEPEKKG